MRLAGGSAPQGVRGVATCIVAYPAAMTFGMLRNSALRGAFMTEAETATALGVTERTVRRDWVKAKGWLLSDLDRDDGS